LRIHTAEDSLFKKCGGIPQIIEGFCSRQYTFLGVLWRSFLTNGQTLDVCLAVLVTFVDLVRRMEEFQKVIVNCYISV